MARTSKPIARRRLSDTLSRESASGVGALPGFLGAQLSRRQLGDTIEFLVLTRWRTIGAIQDFAASDIAKAIVEPGAIAALIDFDRSVLHYEVIEDAVP